ncbi:MAG: regulatory protein RecX [Atopobiaceae bacterium]|nr:regulatory protein RecX [Atopobiaceae bacterium]
MQEPVQWEVIPPAQRHCPSWADRPRSTLVIEVPGQSAEEILLPLAVGKALNLRSKRGELRTVTRKELLEAVTDLQRSCAKERMFSHLERRDMAKGELMARLGRDGYPRFAVEHALSVGERCGLLDDVRFAERFAQRKSRSGWGIKRIEMELGKRGIDVSTLVGWPDDFLAMDEEYQRALDVATRKHVKEPNACGKLARFLVGRGFSQGIALRAARESLG